MTRRSKIANLRKEIRDDFNQKLEDGEPANQLVDWLNNQPEVQDMLRIHFKGLPITEQNVSDWRQSGFLDWQRAQQAWGWMEQLGDEADELKERGFGNKISGWFGILMSAEMTSTARELIQRETDPEARWQRLCAVYKQVSRLRRDDFAASRMRLRQEKWLSELKQLMQKGKTEFSNLSEEDSSEIFRRKPSPEDRYTPPEPPAGNTINRT